MRIRSVLGVAVVAGVAVAASIAGSLTASAAGQRGTGVGSLTALQTQSSLPRGSTFTPITPCRIVDTRRAPAGAIPGGSTRTFAIDSSITPQGGNASGCGIPADDVTAVQANVVSVDAIGAGYLTLFPADGSAPVASFLNFRDGKAVAKGGTVTVSSDSQAAFAVRVSRTTDVVVDISGYYSAPMFAVVAPDRTLIASSGVSVVLSGRPGVFQVLFHRFVDGCSFRATSTDPSILVGAVQARGFNGRVNVSLLDSKDLTPRSGGFSLTVTC
jgi:hypothetical protein